MAVNEPFWASITIAAQNSGVMVSLPPGSPFELLRQGGTSSFSFSFGGSSQRSQQTIRWQLRALSAGRHTLGPLVVNIGGQQYRAGTAVIDVVSGGGSSSLPPSTLSGSKVSPGQIKQATPQKQPSKGQSIPEQVAAADLDGAVFDNEMFLRTMVEPREAVVGQQIIMTVYLYRRIRIDEWTLSREPTTEGFWVEDLGRQQQESRQFVDQTMYVVHHVKRTALFPLREGTLTIGAPQVEARTGFSFFSRRASTVVRDGVPVQVVVRALPEKGRPESFEAENIGRFEITARVDKRSSKVGEPVTLKVVVSGRGNLRKVKIPPLGEIEGARVYEPRVNDAVAAQGGELVGERRWEYLILPQKEGSLELPSVELGFFDPSEKQYKTIRSKSVIVEVSGRAAAGSADVVQGVDDLPEIEGESRRPDMDSLHLIHREAALTSGTTPMYWSWWFIVLLVIAPAGFVVVVVVQRVRHHKAATRDVVRSRRAAQVARKALDEIAEGDVEDAMSRVMKVFNEFFVDRIGRSLSGLTMEELRLFVIERGASEELAGKVVSLIERSEHARFAGAGGDASDVGEGSRDRKGRDEGKQVALEAKALVEELERLSAIKVEKGEAL